MCSRIANTLFAKSAYSFPCLHDRVRMPEAIFSWRIQASNAIRRTTMKELTEREVAHVFGGELQCTVGTDGASCTGSLQDFGDAIFGAYDHARMGTANFFEWCFL